MPKTSDRSSPNITTTIPAFGGLFAVVDCRSSFRVGLAPLPASDIPSLYERLGGREGVRSLVRDFLAVVEDDLRINTLLCPVERQRLEPLLVERITDVTGGPCEPNEGRTTQAGLMITMHHLHALIDDFSIGLKRSGIAEYEAAELIALFAPIPLRKEKRPRLLAETAP